MEHTPGPWRYQEESDAYTHIVRGPSNEYVAGFSQDSSGNAEADARFVAMAPKMEGDMAGLREELKQTNFALRDAIRAREADASDLGEFRAENTRLEGLLRRAYDWIPKRNLIEDGTNVGRQARGLLGEIEDALVLNAGGTELGAEEFFIGSSPAVIQRDSRMCSDCPPSGYPTDKTRCEGCPK